MKKIIYFFVLTVLLISFSGANAFAQTLYIDAHVGELKEIDDSKYRASAVSIIRNANGELISLTKTDASRYLDDPILDKFLNSKPEYLIKQGKLNEHNINLYTINIEYSNPKCTEKVWKIPGFNDRCNWHHRAFSTMLGLTDNEGVEHIIFSGLNHAQILKSDYDVKIFWNVITLD